MRIAESYFVIVFVIGSLHVTNVWVKRGKMCGIKELEQRFDLFE